MTVIMFQPRFVEPIQAGTKRQTIRPPRLRSIVVGDQLSLRVWEDKPYRSHQVEILAAECTGIFNVLITEEGVRIGIGPLETRRGSLDGFARADGFSSWREMREFVRSRFSYGLPFGGVLIQFAERRPQQLEVSP